MSNTQQLIVCGAKFSKGEYEGNAYDSTVVYIQAPLDSSQDKMAGFTTIEYKWGKSTNFDKIKDMEYPFTAYVTFETVSTGRSSKVILTDLQPA